MGIGFVLLSDNKCRPLKSLDELVKLWPPSNHPLSFWGVLTGMVFIAGLMLVYFRRRKWL